MNGLQSPKISLSIVLFHTDQEDIENIFRSFDNIKANFHVFIVDNSSTDELKSNFIEKENYTYIHNPSNPGFGASHNIAFKMAIEQSYEYHFVVNPDVYFDKDVVTPMVDYMAKDISVGMMMPQILNFDGSSQGLPKLLPSPFSIVFRKIKKPSFLFDKYIAQYELANVPSEMIYNAPILSGCFTLFRIEYLKEIGLYDDRFFMYFEDWDISRRMHEKYKTLYWPKVSVYHRYESGANKSKRLFKVFINSAQTYFSKWGWFADRRRNEINKRTLEQFK